MLKITAKAAMPMPAYTMVLLSPTDVFLGLLLAAKDVGEVVAWNVPGLEAKFVGAAGNVVEVELVLDVKLGALTAGICEKSKPDNRSSMLASLPSEELVLLPKSSNVVSDIANGLTSGTWLPLPSAEDSDAPLADEGAGISKAAIELLP